MDTPFAVSSRFDFPEGWEGALRKASNRSQARLPKNLSEVHLHDYSLHLYSA